jgi:hypothetical protein
VSSTEEKHLRRVSQQDLVQYAANVVTVISGLGGVTALFSGQLIWAVPAVAGLAFTMYSLKNHRWKPATFGLAAVMLAGATGAAGYSRHAGQKDRQARSANPGAASSSPAPAPAGTSSSPASSAPRVLLDSDVTLERHAAADVDGAKPQVLRNQAGADGTLDIYFDPSGLPGTIIAHNAEGVFNPGEGITDAYAACKDQFDVTSSDRNANLYGYVSTGSGFCLKTSASRMAYAVVVAIDQPVKSEAPQTVTLHVTVWDEALP